MPCKYFFLGNFSSNTYFASKKKPGNSDDNTDHFDKYHFYDGGKNDVTHDEHDQHCFQLKSKIPELSPDLHNLKLKNKYI